MIWARLVGTEAFERRIRDAQPQIMEALVDAVNRATIRLQNRVRTGYLSGQVLRVRTGTLRRSITQNVERASDRIIGRVGTNVVYGAVHEYGGKVDVPAHMSRSRAGRAFSVRAHTATYPQRAFLHPALAEMKSEINQSLADAVRRAVSKALKQ